MISCHWPGFVRPLIPKEKKDKPNRRRSERAAKAKAKGEAKSKAVPKKAPKK